jgi:hypothetical protein
MYANKTAEFLSLLFSEYFKDHDGKIELRLIPKDSGAAASAFFRLEEFSEEVLPAIQDLNSDYHVYVGVNPRPLSGEKKEEDIKDIVCLWADLDGKDFEGGKPEALQRVQGFPLPPSIVVDSGHGYHCYWVLRDPILGITGDKRLAFKQILSGVVKKLEGDKHPLFLNALLRLPGTFNIKEDEPLECRVIQLNTEKKYCLDDFGEFKDDEYQEPKEAEEVSFDFGRRQLIISLRDRQSALADVGRLEVDSKIKRRIITGSKLTARNADKTRSGRDMSVICSLIYNDYDYATIRSVFFNPFLGCSNRIMAKGEAALQWDVRRAREFVQKAELTPEAQKVLDIKKSPFIPKVEKPIAINDFIVKDLISGKNPIGRGFRRRATDIYYYFDRDEKRLMDLDSTDFYLFVRHRYGILRWDFDEIKDAIKTAIQASGQEVEPYRLAYFNNKDFILYVSNHDNQVYRLDGERIELCDNGTDGVFFEFDPELEPFEFDPSLEVTNYFQPDAAPDSTVGEPDALGFSYEKFLGSYLDQYLVSRARFGQETKNDLDPEYQRFLFAIYFYSLFFKSVQREKVLICLVGSRESGKSFIATSIGKILFGDNFDASRVSDNQADLEVVLAGNYYLVFDNLDSSLANDIISTLCMSATGFRANKRKLYTDRDQVRFASDSFVAITTREPKFKRDDLVSRLLLFKTEEIEEPLSRSYLLGTLLENRNKIMTEVIANLNTVVEILKMQRGVEFPCLTRIADWESLGRKLCHSGIEAEWFVSCMAQMKESKGAFALEDDYLYQVLDYIIYEQGQKIEEVTAQGLYDRLLAAAKEMSILDFGKRYKSPRSVTARFKNVKKDLEIKFKVEIGQRGKKQKTYSFGPLAEPQEPVETKVPTEPVEPPPFDHPATAKELLEMGCIITEEELAEEDRVLAEEEERKAAKKKG